MANSSQSTSNAVFFALVKVFHLLGAIQFAFGVYYDYVHVNIPQSVLFTHVKFGGKFKYLTFIDAVNRSITFTIILKNCYVTLQCHYPNLITET